MRKAGEKDRIACSQCGVWMAVYQVWDATLPDGKKIIYGVIPEHASKGSQCEGVGHVAAVTPG